MRTSEQLNFITGVISTSVSEFSVDLCDCGKELLCSQTLVICAISDSGTSVRTGVGCKQPTHRVYVVTEKGLSF